MFEVVSVLTILFLVVAGRYRWVQSRRRLPWWLLYQMKAMESRGPSVASIRTSVIRIRRITCPKALPELQQGRTLSQSPPSMESSLTYKSMRKVICLGWDMALRYQVRCRGSKRSIVISPRMSNRFQWAPVTGTRLGARLEEEGRGDLGRFW